MILYKKGGIYHILNLLRVDGSVFPRLILPSATSAALAALLKHYTGQQGFNLLEEGIMKDTIMWSSFSFLVGFLIVFRTSMAYSRFWEGCTQVYRMRAAWIDAASSLTAFCKLPCESPPIEVLRFQNLLIRLFSMLHALALAEIEDSSSNMPEEVEAFKFELIDASAIDAQSLLAIKNSDAKVELVYQWIQQVIIEHLNVPGQQGVLTIPPPILSRVFQQLADGIVSFQEAIKVSSIPFPFPYAQTCDCLLTIHWIVTPIVVSQWFTAPGWAALFTYLTVFIHWVLNCIAVEIENPFGTDPNDIMCSELQVQMNRHLLQMLTRQQRKTPRLEANVQMHGLRDTQELVLTENFLEVWDGASEVAIESIDIRRSCRAYRETTAKISVAQQVQEVQGMFSPKRGSVWVTDPGRQSFLVPRESVHQTKRESAAWDVGDDAELPLSVRMSSGSSTLGCVAMNNTASQELYAARGARHCSRRFPNMSCETDRVSVSDIDDERSITLTHNGIGQSVSSLLGLEAIDSRLPLGQGMPPGQDGCSAQGLSEGSGQSTK